MSGPSQGSRRGSIYSWGLVGTRGNRGDPGTGTYSLPSCARWHSERATNGIVAFPPTRDPKCKTVSPLGLQRRGEHKKTRVTQRIQPFLFRIFRKPKVHQVLDEMTKALHISEKSPKFKVG